MSKILGLTGGIACGKSTISAYLKKFGKVGTYDLNASGVITRNGIQEKVYQRILIINRKFAPNS